MASNILQEKSFNFAVRISNLTKFITTEHKEFNISNQLFRSGTSIGAIVEEAIGGQSMKDFISKISIAYKETRETQYWLKLLLKLYPEYKTKLQELIDESEELLKISGKIISTSKEKLKSSN